MLPGSKPSRYITLFSFTEEEDGDFDSVIEKFNSYCNPKKNETYERYVFHSRKQLQGEPIEQFVTDLKLKAQTCQFENPKDSMIRDRLVLGVTNTRVRERLLREENLHLDKAVKICQAAEATERQIQKTGYFIPGLGEQGLTQMSR